MTGGLWRTDQLTRRAQRWHVTLSTRDLSRPHMCSDVTICYNHIRLWLLCHWRQLVEVLCSTRESVSVRLCLTCGWASTELACSPSHLTLSFLSFSWAVEPAWAPQSPTPPLHHTNNMRWCNYWSDLHPASCRGSRSWSSISLAIVSTPFPLHVLQSMVARWSPGPNMASTDTHVLHTSTPSHHHTITPPFPCWETSDRTHYSLQPLPHTLSLNISNDMWRWWLRDLRQTLEVSTLYKVSHLSLKLFSSAVFTKMQFVCWAFQLSASHYNDLISSDDILLCGDWWWYMGLDQ